MPADFSFRSTFMRPAAICALGLSALALSACGSSRTLGGTFGDMDTHQTLRASLMDSHYEFDDIDTTIFESRLMLTGTVRTEAARNYLVQEVWKIGGISQVIDEVLIADKTGSGQGLADTRIDQTIRTRLITSNNVTSRDYKLAVSNGVVYFLGKAHAQHDLERALNIAASVRGVRKVVSHVRLNPQLATR